jgi:hypothetical protein
MRKSKKATPHTYTDVTALYTHFHIHNPIIHKNLAVSRTPNKPDEPNVLGVFLDVNIGFVYSSPQLSRGQAGEALESYTQDVGTPVTIRTDNAEEFLAGKFANLQNRMALPGRCTPFELLTGRQPNVTNIRIFGCEAMAYVYGSLKNPSSSTVATSSLTRKSFSDFISSMITSYGQSHPLASMTDPRSFNRLRTPLPLTGPRLSMT